MKNNKQKEPKSTMSNRRRAIQLSTVAFAALLAAPTGAMAVANLTTTLSAPATVTNSFTYAYTATVNNVGTASAGAITLRATLPTGLNFVSGNSVGGFACSAVAQVVTCTRTTSIPAAGTDSVTINVNATTGATFSQRATIVGGGDTTVATSNTVTTAVNLADLSVVSVGQPAPALKVNAMSRVPIVFRNVGNIATPSPINVTVFLPNLLNAAGQTVTVGTPLKFIFNNWTCRSSQGTTGTTVNCARPLPIAAATNVTLRIPVTPDANSLNTQPSFQASIDPVVATWDPNLANNGPVTTVAATAVTNLALRSIIDPLYSTPILNPTSIPKWSNELLNLANPVFVHTPDTVTYPGFESYKLDIKQIKSQVLPAGYPATPVYAYGNPNQADSYSYPAHSIVARSTDPVNTSGLGRPVKIAFSNTGLLSANTALMPAIDHSIMGTNAGEPDVRSVTHLHGMKIVDQINDGYPESWVSPSGQTGAPMTIPSIPYNPNPFDYTNNQESTLLWYHDHTLGITHNNVYAGLAGAYLLRDDNEMNKIAAKQLPDPNYEIPLVFQDRMFKTDGTLAYPDTVPGAITPSVVPEFFGEVMVVNGTAWPYMNVEPRKYRFRLLNGSGSRFYTFALSSGQSFQVLGSDEGFLNAPVSTASLTIAPAERYDVIVDFTGRAGQTITLTNSAATVGIPVTPNASRIMRFRVNQPMSTIAEATIPASLRPTPVPTLTNTPGAPVRQLLLMDNIDQFQRVTPSLGTIANGPLDWMSPMTETPTAHTVEEWQIYNNSVDIHPIHLHGGHFQVVDRYPLTGLAAPTAAFNTLPSLVNFGTPSTVANNPIEGGWKDTAMASPLSVTRIRVKFEGSGLYVWHCHILEHEDHDMMRPLKINP